MRPSYDSRFRHCEERSDAAIHASARENVESGWIATLPSGARNDASRGLQVRLAQSPADIAAAQHLRYRIFSEELGAHLPLENQKFQRDEDRFDALCDHLLVTDRGHVVGTYRLLPGARLRAGESFYSETEFDLSRLRAQGKRLLEMGRSCVHPEYRHRGTIALLWRGIAAYIQAHGIDFLFGCASFPGADPAAHQVGLQYLFTQHSAQVALAPRALRDGYVPPQPDTSYSFAALPALIKGYLRAGAKVGQGAAVDLQCNTVDVCMVLETQKLAASYARHFMIAAGEG